MIQQPDVKVLKNYMKVRLFVLLIIADQMLSITDDGVLSAQAFFHQAKL